MNGAALNAFVSLFDNSDKKRTEEEQKRFDAALRRKQLSLVLAGKMNPHDATELKALFV